jgi:hypothetical protein
LYNFGFSPPYDPQHPPMQIHNTNTIPIKNNKIKEEITKALKIK